MTLKKLLPFERTILSTVGASLPRQMRGLFEDQLRHVNKVQRLLEWNEIELYCMRWFRVRWPEGCLFPDKEEVVLGSGLLSASTLRAEVKVWAVGGHVFSIESPVSLKPFKDHAGAAFTLGK